MPEMSKVDYSESWLHTYLLLGLDAGFPVSEAIFHSMTYGKDFEGYAHRKPVPMRHQGCNPVYFHGYIRCKNKDYSAIMQDLRCHPE